MKMPIMRGLEIADADVMRMAIQQYIARADESWYDHREHGLQLVTASQSCRQVFKLFGEERRMVQRSVTSFEANVLIGLCHLPHVEECGCRSTPYCRD
jgi:hypothetical protein